MNWKRSLPIVLALIVVLYAGAAWFLGRTIEQRLGETMTEFSGKTPYVRIVDSHFHRGWFVSEQDVTVEAFGDAAGAPPGVASAVAAPLQLSIHNVIHHGPICGFTCLGVAQIDSHLVWSEAVRAYLTPIFGSSEPLSIRLTIGFFGGGTASVSSPSIPEAVLSGGAHLSSQGFDLHGDYRANYDAYAFRGSLPHLLFKSSDSKQSLEITEFGVDAHSKRALRSLYTGDSSATLETLTLAGVTPTGPVSLKDLQSASSSTLTDGYMSITYKLGAASVVTAPLTLTGVHFDFTFRHLDAESLEQLISVSQTSEQASVSPTERLAKMTAALKIPASSLLAHQPEIIIDRISLATAAGGALLTGAIKTNGIAAEDIGANPMAMLQKVDADMQFTVDDAFLTSLPGGAMAIAQLQPFVTQGLIVHDANKFRTVIAFHQGKATFNGKSYCMGGPAIK